MTKDCTVLYSTDERDKCGLIFFPGEPRHHLSGWLVYLPSLGSEALIKATANLSRVLWRTRLAHAPSTSDLFASSPVSFAEPKLLLGASRFSPNCFFGSSATVGARNLPTGSSVLELSLHCRPPSFKRPFCFLCACAPLDQPVLRLLHHRRRFDHASTSPRTAPHLYYRRTSQQQGAKK